MLKIVINALSARVGGGQTYLTNLLGHLPEQPDLDVLVFAPVSLCLPADRRIRRKMTAWSTDNPLLRALWEVIMLPRILKREGSQVLFCPGGLLLTRVPGGCKTATMFRNMLPFEPAAIARVPFGLQKVRNLVLKSALLRGMKRADLTIFVSDYARLVIEEKTHVPNPVTIPHGISEAFRTHDNKMRRPSWLPTSEYCLYVSRFDVYKHQFEVVSAFVRLPSDLINRYTLLLVGELDNVMAGRIASLVRAKGLENRIIIVGPVAYADLPALYHHATVNLFASSCENCPNILLEALAAGRPLLSSNVMPMPEFGLDCVEYFSPVDPNSISEALTRVLRDESLQARLAAAAVRRSAAFDWAETARKTWRQIFELTTNC